MEKNFSFTKYEQQIRPSFRQHINTAESTEDVKKFFAYSMRQLVDKALAGRVMLEFDDIALNPSQDKGFTVSEKLLKEQNFSSTWENSDLPNIVERLAEPAVRRFRRLEKNPSKTELKIFHNS